MIHLAGLVIGIVIFGLVAFLIILIEKKPIIVVYISMGIILALLAYGVGNEILTEVLHIDINK